MELRNESIFINNLTKKENIEKAIKEVKPDIYIFDQSNSMTLNFDEDFLKHEIEFYRKYNEPQKKKQWLLFCLNLKMLVLMENLGKLLIT